MSRKLSTTNLLLVHLKCVSVGHFERVWCVGRLDALPVEQEADLAKGLALAVAECVHELLQLCRSLDLEKDLVIVVRHLDIEVLWGSRITTASRCTTASTWVVPVRAAAVLAIRHYGSGLSRM